MSRKRNTAEFIELAIHKHGTKYDYSKVNYIDAKTNIEIICPKHGSFFQSPDSHLRGSDCWTCSYEIMNRKKSLLAKNGFVNKARTIRGDIYDYSRVDYVKANIKVEFICREHGSFHMTPNNFINGQDCPMCSRLRQTALQTFDTAIFISKATEIHGDRYDYSLVRYETARLKVKIICREHGLFLQTAFDHLAGQEGCRICFKRKLSNSISLTHDEFIERAVETHGDRYDYSMAEYKGMRFPVSVICPKHGVFTQSANRHTHGGGCPKCWTASKGEAFIAGLLSEMGVEFEREKTFPTCRVVKKRRFDFYLPDMGILIEYQGLQHFTPVDRMGGLMGLMTVKSGDEFKKNWARENGYVLKEYCYNDSRDYIARSLRGICAYYKNNRPKT